ncbi:hypothetical protein ACFVP8_03970 [Viridibacillus arvi]
MGLASFQRARRLKAKREALVQAELEQEKQPKKTPSKRKPTEKEGE